MWRILHVKLWISHSTELAVVRKIIAKSSALERLNWPQSELEAEVIKERKIH